MKTCAGYDSSAPQDVLVGIKAHLKKTQPGRKHLDKEDCCILQDVESKAACNGDDCKYAADGKKKDIPGAPKIPV